MSLLIEVKSNNFVKLESEIVYRQIIVHVEKTYFCITDSEEMSNI